ncbi:hypothetical protein RGQ29_029631 [Quercus rubra]|uniref:ZF-HD dimerization-type domain-containing protein n=1 Tax=Quercus rubra TaxID=3512 RepID=A0AAN7EFR7_QUERU|nr:hypothetical protein RGQ29_029631 [Quercus rubra]
MDLTVVPYNNHTPKSENGNDDVKKNSNNNNHHNNNNNNNNNNNDVADREPVVMNPSSKTVNNTVITVEYKECMRNHAASLGGHANDGCGEFMPLGTTNNNNNVVKDQQHENSLTCAACGCHRNFHRREVFGGELPHHHPVHLHSPPPMFALYNGGPAAVPRGHPHHHHHHQYHQHHGGDHHDRGRSETPERVVGPVGITRSGSTNNTTSAKRFRTKFTPEQKEKMLEFAERIGWRIQRHDDVALNQFCSEIGVKRNVLKVWMHNNKNAHRRRESGPDDSPSEPPQQEEEQPIGS